MIMYTPENQSGSFVECCYFLRNKHPESVAVTSTLLFKPNWRLRCGSADIPIFYIAKIRRAATTAEWFQTSSADSNLLGPINITRS